MAKYDPSTVESMDFDFTKWSSAPEAKGEVPEPSQDQIVEFFEGQQRIAFQEAAFNEDLVERRKQAAEQRWVEQNLGKDFPGHDNLPPLTAAEQLAMMDGDRAERDAFREQMRRAYVGVIAAACQGLPSSEVLDALPYRQLQGFAGWLTGQFSPEAWAAAISR